MEEVVDTVERRRKDMLEKLRQSIISDNPILFKDAHRPMSETCMCWGLECGDGWLYPLSDGCAQLEGLNSIFYKMFRVRVQADQVKEKFGTLRFYTTVCIDPPRIVCWYEHLIEKLFDILCSKDYKFKTVVDQEAWKETLTEVYTDKEKFDKEAAENRACNVFYTKDAAGKMLKLTMFEHCQKTHQEPQQHKLLFWVSKHKWKTMGIMRRILCLNPSKVQCAAAALLDMLQRKIIQEVEHECFNTCERCGRRIGSSYSPRCETVGWTTYICTDCADKTKENYYKNGELWKEGKMVLSKEDVEAKMNKAKNEFAELVESRQLT